MKFILKIFILCLLLVTVNGSYDDISTENAYNLRIYKKYLEMDNQLKDIADKGAKMILPYLVEAREHINVSASCTSNLFHLLSGVRNLKEWAVKFLDATGKPLTGLSNGNVFMVGDYELCMDIAVKKKDGKLNYQGQYCSVLVNSQLPKFKKIPSIYDRLEGFINATSNASGLMKFMASNLHFAYYGKGLRIGICIPKGCSKNDVSEMMKYGFGKINLNTSIEYCLKKEELCFWTPITIFCTGFFIFIGLLTSVITILEYFKEHWITENPGVFVKILQCFSISRNVSILFNSSLSDKQLPCLNGIRVLSIFWIILGHEYSAFIVTETGSHLFKLLDMVPRFLAQIIWNSFLAVDTFFFLSGFLNAYIRLNMKKNGTTYGALKMIVHRIWRIYPALATSHLLFFLINKPGPFSYAVMQKRYENCERNWWMNFLFINNFVKHDIVCMGYTWYVSADTQLFLISLITVPLIFRNPKIGVVAHLCLIFFGNLFCFIWWWVKQLPPSTVDFSRPTQSFLENLDVSYFSPIPHFGPYFIGILLGYFIADNTVMKMSKFKKIIGWLLAISSFLAVIFLTKIWNSGKPYTRLDSSLYGAFFRTVYALAIAWMIFCCANGYGGVINSILSMKIWIPISKVVFFMYLTHQLIQLYFYSSLIFPFDFSNKAIVRNFFADLTLTLLLSCVLFIIAESPCIGMEKILFKRKKREERKSESSGPNEIVCNVVNEKISKEG